MSCNNDLILRALTDRDDFSPENVDIDRSIRYKTTNSILVRWTLDFEMDSDIYIA